MPVVTAPAYVTASQGGYIASVPLSPSTYAWSITNGTITAGQGTASITFTVGPAVSELVGLSCMVTNQTALLPLIGTATSTIVAAPAMSSFTPTMGVVGTIVTLTGTAFTGAKALHFNGLAAASFTVVSPTLLTAVVPVGASTGPISVTTIGGTTASNSNFSTLQDVILQITPTLATLDPGQSLQFGYRYDGPSGSSLVWSCSGGAISQSGLYTAPNAPGSYTVSLYITAQPSLVRQAFVMVPAPLLQLTPSSAFLAPWAKQQFQTPTNSGTVTWSVVESNGGTITQAGMYTAPSSIGTFTVCATAGYRFLSISGG